ncbi:Uncharacterised protein [Mycobacteroides abscessus subsp. abscessus]|nr:Uncharacterised protein [Mycobacteroides abscessus subsp. abscessus]
MTNCRSGVRAATSGTTHPPWLIPHIPMRRGSISARPRAHLIAASASFARSCMLWSSQLPAAPPIPGLFQDREAYPALANDSQIGL